MPEDLLTAPPEFKIYKENAIFGATFLGGPTYSGWRAVWIAIVGAIFLVAVLFGVIILIRPDAA